jgi:hypothetical protein
LASVFPGVLLLAAVVLFAEVAGAVAFTVTGLDCGLLVLAAAFVGPLCTVTAGFFAVVLAAAPASFLAATAAGLALLLPPLAAGAGVPEGLGLACGEEEFCAVAIVAMAVASARI